MNTHFGQHTNTELIYLYDLPKDLVTSVRIATIIKAKTGYDLTEPVQFRECRSHPTNFLPSPYTYGIIKVDKSEWSNVAKGIKYFKYDIG